MSIRKFYSPQPGEFPSGEGRKEEFKKAIEEAAEREYPLYPDSFKLSELVSNELTKAKRSVFIKGALSPEAKAYHLSDKRYSAEDLLKIAGEAWDKSDNRNFKYAGDKETYLQQLSKTLGV